MIFFFFFEVVATVEFLSTLKKKQTYKNKTKQKLAKLQFRIFSSFCCSEKTSQVYWLCLDSSLVVTNSIKSCFRFQVRKEGRSCIVTKCSNSCTCQSYLQILHLQMGCIYHIQLRMRKRRELCTWFIDGISRKTALIKWIWRLSNGLQVKEGLTPWSSSKFSPLTTSTSCIFKGYFCNKYLYFFQDYDPYEPFHCAPHSFLSIHFRPWTSTQFFHFVS